MIKILLFTIFLVAVASEVLNDEVRKITFYLKQDLQSLREMNDAKFGSSNECMRKISHKKRY